MSGSAAAAAGAILARAGSAAAQVCSGKKVTRLAVRWRTGNSQCVTCTSVVGANCQGTFTRCLRYNCYRGRGLCAKGIQMQGESLGAKRDEIFPKTNINRAVVY